MSDLFELAKITQDNYMSGSYQGQLFALESLERHIQGEKRRIQELIDQIPIGKTLKGVKDER
jgi:hypothetical protein